MAGSQQAIKARIRSVKSTKKITKAMEMIANAKLAKLRKTMELNRNYASALQGLVEDILSTDQDFQSKFFGEHKSDKTFSILFCSDLGLCGGYNANIVKFAHENLKKEDPLFIFGTHAYEQLKREGYNLLNKSAISVDSLDEQRVRQELDRAIKMYINDEVGKIQVLYTRFINTVTFEPQLNVILPYEKKGTGKSREIIFDPSIDKVLDSLIEQMIYNVGYALSMETKTAEQASRRMAMETASDNADELEESLVLQYNKARQAAITQELTEIVGTANAL